MDSIDRTQHQCRYNCGRVQDKENYHPLKLIGSSLLQIRELSIRQLVQAFVFSTVGHGTAFMGVWISLVAIGGSPSPVDIAFVYLVGTCCGTVAFLFPGSHLPGMQSSLDC